MRHARRHSGVMHRITILIKAYTDCKHVSANNVTLQQALPHTRTASAKCSFVYSLADKRIINTVFINTSHDQNFSANRTM